ncbi:MAG TPA: hypothetical protein VKB12_04970 [Pyrinomonadaceae bacterium]|nr:hypothetical protein [Pyrinomonadaceae bacterium]
MMRAAPFLSAPRAPSAAASTKVRVNGHRASHRFEGKTLAAGDEYVLFLWWSPNFNAYYLAGGSSGAFRVGADGRVSPLGTKAGVLRHKGGGLQAVIDEILAAQ